MATNDVFVTTQVSGANCFTAPELLAETAYVRGVNLSSRSGVLHTRPVFTRVADLPAGKFQGAYALFEVTYVIVGGKIYKADAQGEWVAIDGVAFSPYVDMVYATIVYDYLFLNDGVHMPAIVGPYGNRHLAKQGDDPEIPCGSLCCFGQGRIFFFDPTQKTLMAGDIYLPGQPESCLKFTEQAFLNESLAITQPAAYGKAMSMQFVRNSETGTGLGQLIVFYENGYCAYNVYYPRSEWLDQQLGQSLGRYAGAGGQNFVAQQNNDLFFRTGNGLTTLRDYASQTNEGLRALPITIPIGPLLARDQTWTLEQGSIVSQDSRALFTHGLRRFEGGQSFYDSLVSFDMASFYAEGNTQMTFDGVWTGPRVTKVFSGKYKGNDVTFITSKTSENGNVLWKLSDQIYDGAKVSPRSRWYSRYIDFGSPFQYAKFLFLDLWLSGMRADVEVRLFFRSDSELWQEASNGAFTVPYYTSGASELGAGEQVLPQGRAKVRIAIDEEVFDPVSLRALRFGTAFQFCLEVTGVAASPKMWFKAEVDDGDKWENRLCESEGSGTLLTTAGNAGIVLYDYDTEFLE